jgi:hypothetical protein
MRPLFDNRSLIDWLASQPPAKPYDYANGSCCLITQYLRSRGFTRAVVDSHSAYLDGSWGTARRTRTLPPSWNDIAQQKPWTFGAALERARSHEREHSRHRYVRPTAARGNEAAFVLVDELEAQ